MCHCRACQWRTGSAFGVQARFAREQVAPAGHSTRFVREGDSGNAITFHFCSGCGSTVYWEPQGASHLVVAVGAFADPEFPAPEVSVYEERKLAWVPTSALDVRHMA
jgi:hypothetical protein